MLNSLLRLFIAIVAFVFVALPATVSSDATSPKSKMDGALRSAFALGAAQTSESPGGLGLLAGTVAMYQANTLLDAHAARSASAGDIEIGVLLKTSGEAGDIANTGARVGSKTGHIVTARGSLDEIWRIAALDEVSAVEAAIVMEPTPLGPPMAPLSVAREPALEVGDGAQIDFVDFHAAGFRGEGVVVGVLDTGIWPEHPSFADDSGNSRIGAAWDQTDGGGPPPSGFAYGTHWTNQQFTDDLQNPACPPSCDVRLTDTDGHGTGVAGAAFGVPFDGTTGTAPGAYPVIVKTNFATDSILDGVAFIQNVAQGMGYPTVINFSFGSQFGAHDGTSLFEQALQSYTDQGVAVIAAAGNQGNSNIHTWFDFTGSAVVEPSAELPAVVQEPTRFTYHFWYDGEEDVCVNLNTPNGFSNPAPVCPGNSTTFDTDDGCFFITNVLNPNNGDHEVIFDIFGGQFGCQANTAGGTWGMSFNGSAVVTSTTKVDGWATQGAPPFNDPFGDNRSTVQIPATSSSVFAAGASVVHNQYTAADGQTYGLDPFSAVGSLHGTSGRGPNRLGDIKPDITTPGAIIKAPASQDANLPQSNLYPGELFQAISGTSMSAPHTAGVFALINQANPNWTDSQIRDILINGARADSFTGAVPNHDFGYGKIDLSQVAYNDSFAGAAIVTSLPYNDQKFIGSAIVQSNEPIPACVTEVNNTIWYQATLPAGQDHRVNMLTSNFDGFIGAYHGTSIDSLQEIGCTNYTGIENASIVIPGQTSPQDVYFQLGSQDIFIPRAQAGSSSPSGAEEPLAKFAISAVQLLPWGDLDCDGDSDSVDALKALQTVAGLPVNQPAECNEFGDTVFTTGDGVAYEGPWGDLDCDGDGDSVDALKALQNVAGLPVNQPALCPGLGSEATVPIP